MHFLVSSNLFYLWRTEVYVTKIETRPFIDSLLEDLYVFIVKIKTYILLMQGFSHLVCTFVSAVLCFQTIF